MIKDQRHALRRRQFLQSGFDQLMAVRQVEVALDMLRSGKVGLGLRVVVPIG